MDNLRTIQDFIRWGATQFEHSDIYLGHGTDNPIDEAKRLILPTLGLPLNIPSEFYASNITNSEKIDIIEMIRRRIEDRIPTPYLTNRAWFCGHTFYVDERVLIPRSPIGELIENRFKGIIERSPKAILDLCTGSGCIGIASAYAFPDAEIDIADISAEVLDVAETNIDMHAMHEQVTAIASDLFNSIPHKEYDLIVTNPPYVDVEDMNDLPEEFLFEPQLALAAGSDGLDLVNRILRDAPNYLAPNGVLICEVGNSQVHLQAKYPEVPFKWIKFAQGGDGIFYLSREDLIQYNSCFQ